MKPHPGTEYFVRQNPKLNRKEPAEHDPRMEPFKDELWERLKKILLKETKLSEEKVAKEEKENTVFGPHPRRPGVMVEIRKLMNGETVYATLD